MRRDGRRRILGLLSAALLAVASAGWAVAGEPSPVVTDFRGLALKGYDPVAYFTDGEAVEGSSDYELLWRGATWRFASEQNMGLFARWPKRYAPAYGGHCALAAALGKLHRGDPLRWDVVEGRLFVKESTSAQAKWRREPARFIRDADHNWPKLVANRM